MNSSSNKRVLFLQRVLVSYEVDEQTFYKDNCPDDWSEAKKKSVWKRLCEGNGVEKGNYVKKDEGDENAELRVVEMEEGSNPAYELNQDEGELWDASGLGDAVDDLAEVLGDAYDDEDKHFVIKKDTRILVCPDGTEKALEDTGCGWDDPDLVELYAEWNDIGVFFLPNGRRPKDGETEPSFWVQGQDPTYSGEELDETDHIIVRIA